MTFTRAEAVTLMKHVCVTATINDGMSVSKAFAIAEDVVRQQWHPGRPPGTFVNNLGQVCPIVAPHRETTPLKRLFPVSIEALVEADGDVSEAEAGVADEVEELNLMPRVPVAGEDGPEEIDEETALFEDAADAAAQEDSDGDSDE